MFIIETIPVRRGFGRESLSYFHKTDIAVGSIVSIPLRGKVSDAVVIRSQKAENEKYLLKTQSFSLKKIVKVKSKPLFLSSFIKSCEQISDFYAGTTGSVISTLTPSALLENADMIEIIDNDAPVVDQETVVEHLIIQDEDSDRISSYKSMIREEFAKNKSVFFCLPTSAEVKKTYQGLLKGIEEYAYAFHTNLDKKTLVNSWNKATSEKHPVLIVGTGSFLSLPRADLGLIIVDRESSRHFKAQTRPYVDVRKFAEMYAKNIGAKVVFGDIALRVETIWRFRNGELSGFLPPKFKYLSSSREMMIDMKNYQKKERTEFVVLGEEIKSLIRRTKDAHDHMVIFAARRGLSPTTVCVDCGEIVKCSNCGTPTVLHRYGSKTIYLCHRCNNVEDPERRCDFCGSWKLSAIGIGIELVEEELKNEFPEIKVIRIDSDNSKTEKKVLSDIENWKSSPGSILLCTEMALPYVENAENVAIASIDALFSVPDFRINEKVLGLILQLRAISMKNFLIQTRQPTQPAVRAGISGNLLDFYRTEIEEREEFGYPPFNYFIKISLAGNKSEISEEMKEIAELFKDYEIDIFPALSSSTKGKYVMNALLRLKKNDWPNKELLEKFQSLPQKFYIKVDPESLL